MCRRRDAMRLGIVEYRPAAPVRAAIGAVALVSLTLAVGGCFLVSWAPDRPDAGSVSGPAVYVEGCEPCHTARVSRVYAQSRQAVMRIRCGHPCLNRRADAGRSAVLSRRRVA
jgi:hypothetical protein